MTDQAPYWAFFSLDLMSQTLTFWTSLARFSGSDLIIWSNSANFPALKNTFVIPNLKSLSSSPRALNNAYRTWEKILQWNLASEMFMLNILCYCHMAKHNLNSKFNTKSWASFIISITSNLWQDSLSNTLFQQDVEKEIDRSPNRQASWGP